MTIIINGIPVNAILIGYDEDGQPIYINGEIV
jgi:hypothetical protein